MHPFFKSNFQPYIHRGKCDNFCENTIESFNESVKIGFKYIETDLRITADEKIITFHDKDLIRVSNVNKYVHDLSYKEIKKLDLIKGGSIPQLSDVLESFPDTKFNIDFKSPETLLPTLKVLDDHNAYDRVCLASFDSSTLKKVMALRPESCISMGTFDAFVFKVFKKFLHTVDCIQIPVKWKGIPVLSRNLIKFAHDNKIKVNIWTVNNEKEMIKLIDMGVDGIMSDDAMLLKKISEKFNLF